MVLIQISGICQLPNPWSYELQATTLKVFPTHSLSLSLSWFRWASLIVWFSGHTIWSTNKLTTEQEIEWRIHHFHVILKNYQKLWTKSKINYFKVSSWRYEVAIFPLWIRKTLNKPRGKHALRLCSVVFLSQFPSTRSPGLLQLIGLDLYSYFLYLNLESLEYTVYPQACYIYTHIYMFAVTFFSNTLLHRSWHK